MGIVFCLADPPVLIGGGPQLCGGLDRSAGDLAQTWNPAIMR
jgi:hypothetical protein